MIYPNQDDGDLEQILGTLDGRQGNTQKDMWMNNLELQGSFTYTSCVLIKETFLFRFKDLGLGYAILQTYTPCDKKRKENEILISSSSEIITCEIKTIRNKSKKIKTKDLG